MRSLKEGKVVEKDGARLAYELTFNGTKQTTATAISSNGYIVRANLISEFIKLTK